MENTILDVICEQLQTAEDITPSLNLLREHISASLAAEGLQLKGWTVTKLKATLLSMSGAVTDPGSGHVLTLNACVAIGHEGETWTAETSLWTLYAPDSSLLMLLQLPRTTSDYARDFDGFIASVGRQVAECLTR